MFNAGRRIRQVALVGGFVVARRAAVVVAAILLAILAGCSSKDGPAPASTGAGSSQQHTAASAVQCSSLVGKAAAVWVKVVNGPGCWQGTDLTTVASFDCTHGGQLLATGQNPFYWGLTTSTLATQPGSPDTSVGQYGAAWQRCVS